MAAAERAVTEIVFDAGPAEAGARRVERAGKTIIDTNRSVSTAVGKAAEEQAKSQERSARATEMAAAAMRAAQSAIQTTASVASAAAQSTMALARSHEAISAAIAIARRDYVALATNAADLSEKQSAAAASTNTLVRALTALGLAVGVQQYINFVDSMALLNARIGLVTKSTNEYLTAQRAVYTIAQGAAQPIEDLGNLYAKVQEALTPLGKSQGEALRMTETISKAMRVGGGAAAAQQAALVQLGQAFSAGALRGEELNSVIEGSPRLARAIAEGMGIARGELKKYAEEGKITSEAIANAMRSQREVIEREFATLPTTVSAEMTRLNNAVMVAMSQLDKSAGISSTIGALVNDLTAKLGDPKFLDQVGAILNRLGTYARVAADAIGFLIDHLDGALLAFAAFSGAKGLLLAVGAMNTFSLGTKALTGSLAAVGVAATSTQTTIAGLGAVFALTNPISAAISILSAAGVAYLALADHSDAAGRAVDASNKSIDATRATNADAARSLEELAAGYGKADAAARALEQTNLMTAARAAQEAINAQQEVVREAMNSSNGALRRGDLLAAGATEEQIRQIGAAVREFKNEVNPSADALANIHLQIKTFADGIGITNPKLEELMAKMAAAATAAKAAQERLDKANLSLQVLANVAAGATGPTAGLSAEQLLLAERLGLVGQAASTTANKVSDAVASMSKSLSATGGDLSREIEQAQNQLKTVESGGIRAWENLKREQSAALEAQRRWNAARSDLAKDVRVNIPEQLDDALKSDNMTIRLEAKRLQDQVKTLADTRSQIDARVDKLRQSASKAKTEASQEAKNERLVDTLKREFDAREQSERAMAVEAATRRLNAKATEEERKEVEALAGSLYDLKASRDQDARAAQAQIRLSTVGMTDKERDRILTNTKIASEATKRFGETVAGSAADAAKQDWISKEKVIAATEASATAAEKFAQDVKSVSDDIAGDVAEAMYEGFTGKADSILDWFKSLFKRIAVEAIKAQIVLPITTSVVSSMPSLFGIQGGGSAANQNGSGGLLSNGNMLSLGSKFMPSSWTNSIATGINQVGYSMGIGGTAFTSGALSGSITGMGAAGMGSAAGGAASAAGVAAVPGGLTNAAVSGAGSGLAPAMAGGAPLMAYLGPAAAGLTAGGLIGPMVANGNKAVGGLAGAASGAAAGALVGSIIPGVGTLVGAIIGGAGGGLGGLIGTQKPSVGKTASADVTINSGGKSATYGNILTDNEGDAAAGQALGQTVAAIFSAAAAGGGALAKNFGFGQTEKGGYYIGGSVPMKEFGDDFAGMIRYALLEQGGLVGGGTNTLAALRNSTNKDAAEFSKDIGLGASIDAGNTALREMVKTLGGVTDAAKKATTESFAPMFEELSRAQKLGIDGAYKALATDQLKAYLDQLRNPPDYTQMQTDVATLTGQFQAAREAYAQLNPAMVTYVDQIEKETLARLASNQNFSLDQQIREAGGRGYINTIQGFLTTLDQNARSLLAVGEPVNRAQDLFNVSLTELLRTLRDDQLADVTATFGGNIGNLAAQLAAANDNVAQATRFEALFSQIRQDNIQAEIAGLNDQISAAKSAQNQWQSLLTSIGNFRSGLLTGDLSPLSARDKASESLSQFFAAVEKARGGDVDAAGQVQSLAQTALQANKSFLASSEDYARVFAQVQDGLGSVESVAARQVSVQTSQLSTLQASLATQQDMLKALQSNSSDLAALLSGLNSGNMGDILKWSKTQDAGTQTAVNDAAAKATKRARLEALGNEQIESLFGGFSDIQAARANDPSFNLAAWFKAYGINEVMAGTRSIPGFENGGVVGNGMYGVDSVVARYAGGGSIALAGGEGVLTAAATAAIGGAGAVDYINRNRALPANDRWGGNVLPFRGGQSGGSSGSDQGWKAVVAELQTMNRDQTDLGKAMVTELAQSRRLNAALVEENRRLRQQLSDSEGKQQPRAAYK